ncbi:MAG TPA: ATP-dependent DNA ligase [Gemmatimonadales bacterium]|nr:ATP-dependent DNA ligase [Gemmatimonadales bacterium]
MVTLADLVETSSRVTAANGRLEKVALLAALLRQLEAAEVEIGTSYLTGSIRQPRLGVGYAAVATLSEVSGADRASLTVSDVDAALEEIARVGGKGSAHERSRLLRGLWARATGVEQQFLARLLIGELRQGALEGVVLDAVARAAELPRAEVQRAFMTAGDLGTVARAILAGGSGLGEFAIRLFRPVLPMLADTAATPAEALERLGRAAFEFKLDGARIQVHKGGAEVKVYSRRLNEVTAAVPEVVEIVRALPSRELILDGEVIALRSDGSPHAFQTTMSRFGRRSEVDRQRGEVPLTPFFFDLLYLDGKSLLDLTQEQRHEFLRRSLPPQLLITRGVTAEPVEAQAFLDRALAQGHEGVMVKALDARYEAGQRGQRWFKIKPVHTLDLVVLAAEWGNGRRRGWLSNLHLGARDAASGEFVMLGKTFKGMTDEVLAWQTTRLQELEVRRDDYTVYVRPELVVEVAFNDVQSSSQYPGGVALRFARIKGYRPDKSAQDADTIETIREIHRRALGEKTEA